MSVDAAGGPCDACSPSTPFWNKTLHSCTAEPRVPKMEFWTKWMQELNNPRAVDLELDEPISVFPPKEGKHFQFVPRISSGIGKVSLERCATICALSKVCIAWMYGPGRYINLVGKTLMTGYQCVLFARDPKDVKSGGSLRIAMKQATGSQSKLLGRMVQKRFSASPGVHVSEEDICKIEAWAPVKKKGNKYTYTESCSTLAFRKTSFFTGCSGS